MSRKSTLSEPRFTYLSAVAIALFTAATACGDDDGDDGDGSTQGGKGGSQSTAGRAGSAGGGRGGTAGTSSGGTSGRDGSGGLPAGEGGGGASAGEGGGGMSAGEGGATAGQGGADGGTSGAGGGESAGAGGYDPKGIEIFRPEEKAFNAALLDELQVPEGFAVNVFADGLEHARMLATFGDAVYLTRPLQGDVLRLVDTDEDGEADDRDTAATGLANVHGIAFDGSTVYLATPKQVYRGTVAASGAFSGLASIVDDLPDGGQHPYRTLGIGPDSALYISVGSDCDACEETNPEHATLLRGALDGSTRTVFARGLRNTIGFGWHPDTDELWGFDHGSDYRGNDFPPEELNRIESGENYGWPYCYGARRPDANIDDPPGTTKAEYCADTTPPVLEFQAHSAPIAMVFYTGTQFPDEFESDAFVALRGSWNRFPPTGYAVARMRFEGGEPVEIESFVSGFLSDDGRSTFGRPAGIAVAPDGALLFSDDTNGVIYRVSYEGP